MARYIDADLLIECLENLCDDYLYRANEKAKIAVTRCIEILQGTPIADVVEVVRCKDCKSSAEPTSVSRHNLYCNNYDVRFCEKDKKIVCGTHFCSYGERRDA